MANNYLVFREEGRTQAAIYETYAHNERTKDNYNNANIKIELSGNNYYFKRPEKTYWAILKERMESGELTDKGLKKEDAHYYSEILIAVNREYWYGKSQEEIQSFFQSSYDHIAKKFGEDNILSAVVHCDEISTGVVNGTEVELINYHMHVVAVPTVTKQRFFSKRSKEYKELAEQVGEENILKNDKRLLKSTETQISHAKFFASGKDEHHRISYSYSVWQDEILESVKAAGFTDIHRGVTNQKAPHLHPMAYKQVMQKIKEEADGCLPDFELIPFGDDKYLLDKDELQELETAKDKIEQEIASYDLAVDALIEEQSKVYERQNKIFVTELQQQQYEFEKNEYDRLKRETERLAAENNALRNAIKFIKEKVSKLVSCFQNIIESWITLRTNPQIDATVLMNEIDQQISAGIKILNNQEIPTGITEIR